MAYFRVLTTQLAKIQSLLSKTDNWLILINADPDAMASALALQRLLGKKVKSVHIARINAITRPDNLAMIKKLHIHMRAWEENMQNKYQKFAMVDSQPHHSPLFKNIPFSIVIDHHPHPHKDNTPLLTEDNLYDIRPDYGATSTMLVEYLYNAQIRAGRYLATALQYGIRTDTATFGRQTTEVDLRAYHYMIRYADQNLLTQILRSEYFLDWLPYFSHAFEKLRPCGLGHFTYLTDVQSPDILVVIADFFLRVYGLKYIIVAGIYERTAICIFRGSKYNLGELAQKSFSDIGSAGGHNALARAEISLKMLKEKNPALRIDYRRKNQKQDTHKQIETILFNLLKQNGSAKQITRTDNTKKSSNK